MELHACLWNDVNAFHFEAEDLAPLRERYPQIKLIFHRDHESLLKSAATVEVVLTWEFKRDWYPRFPALRKIYTPAAGGDWTEADPDERVPLKYGTFHGSIMAESVLSAILFMSQRMPLMIRNFERRGWDRNLQQNRSLLRNQFVLILGLGHIGVVCAQLLKAVGARVSGVRRNPTALPSPSPGVMVAPVAELDPLLAQADHVVLMLPGDTGTDRFLSRERLLRCKPGVFVYNFGRGNSIAVNDLLAVQDHIGGAFLDVVEEEPLSPDSPLWLMPNLMMTPHSSCVCREYRSEFVAEVVADLQAVVGARNEGC